MSRDNGTTPEGAIQEDELTADVWHRRVLRSAQTGGVQTPWDGPDCSEVVL